MIGEMKIAGITKQVAYRIYEENVKVHGHDSTNKYMGAWHAAFRYGIFKFAEIISNPFWNLERFSSSPRRERWTDAQLTRFIKKANELGYPSIGRCALMCMELMQRPGDLWSKKGTGAAMI
jgi:hypothetical protein